MKREVFTTDSKMRFQAEMSKFRLMGAYAIEHEWSYKQEDKFVSELRTGETWFMDLETLTIVKLIPEVVV